MRILRGVAWLGFLAALPACHASPGLRPVAVAPFEAGAPADAGPVDANAPDLEGSDAGAPGVPLRTAAASEPPPGKRLDVRAGEPTLPVRLMEGRREVVIIPRGRVRLRLNGDPERLVEAPARAPLTIRLRGGTPAERVDRLEVAELDLADPEGLAAERRTWEERGLTVRVQALGAVYGIAGQVLDNRRRLVLLEPALGETEARARQAEILRRYGVRTTLVEEVRTPSHGRLELSDAEGTVLGTAEDALTAITPDGSGFDVPRVEFGVGYAFHGFEDRSYRGNLSLAVDKGGALALINDVGLEDLLRGLVPAEIFSKAPAEALKAQAVTARGEVLAKVGTRHLSDPYLLCSEQHCAVYRGRSGEAASTNAAVEATRGEALFDARGRLVDSVYSAVCGGHTEDNEVVWGGLPNPSLRGVPDLLAEVSSLPDPRRHPAEFLERDLPAACRRTRLAQPGKYRWERRFTATELDGLTRGLDIGPVQAMQVVERGASGRARLLVLSGERGATEIRGELNIRKLFGMLNSALFVVSLDRDPRGRPAVWTFRGGGWGHGVGLCQTGAVGRADAGQGYRTILEHYFNGAQVARLYE